MRTARQPNLWPRPELERQLDMARTHRLTLVTAPPGFGKTSSLRSWSAELPSAWHTLTVQDRDAPVLAARVTEVLRLQVPGLPRRLGGEGAASGPTGQDDAAARAESLASQLSQALAEHLRRSTALILDDVHLVDGADGPARFLDTLVRQAPPSLHVVIATQTGPPFASGRLRERGHVLELDAAAFALSEEETAAWLVGELGAGAGRWAGRVHRATAGWPVATRMAVEDLRSTPPEQRGRRIATLAAEEPFGELARRVLALEPAPTRELLRTVAELDWFTVALCDELGLEDAGAIVGRLRRRGLFIEPVASEPDGYALIALARDHLVHHEPLAPERRDEVRAVATAHWAARGRHDRVLRLQLAAEAWPELRKNLTDVGERLVVTGHADLVQRAVAALPEELLDAETDRLGGIAAQLNGDWALARERFERAAGGATSLDPGLAWRLGLIHHLRGELDLALEVYDRGEVDEPTRDTGLLLAWRATVHWLRGQRDECARLADLAFQHATAVDDAQALAAAHTVLAMLAALDGDRRANDAHYLRALDFAELAGDVLQIVRIRTNRSSHHLEEGGYDAALAELDIAIGLAETTGYGPFAAIALANKAEVRLRLGQLEEAGDDLVAAAGIWRAMGSAMVSYPLNVLGDLQLVRGEVARARESHTMAMAAVEAGGDLQGVVPALAGLSAAYLDEDPVRARELAEAAVAKGESLALVEALVAAGWANHRCGDAAIAVRHALQAVEVATTRRDRVGLARALELQAELEEPDRSLALLDEAIALWEEVGDPIGRASATLARSALLPATQAREVVLGVRDEMRALGCRRLDARATALLDELAEEAPPAVRIELLGGFRVLLRGEPLPPNAWQSRKARDLLKILVARRGRPIAREALVDLLWPDDDPTRTANRLNVALSTVRSVLDPERTVPNHSYVVTDGDAVRLATEVVEVDVEQFLEQATAATRLARSGRIELAVDRLRTAEAMYVGQALEEDVYEDWAVPLREEARATYIEVAGTLAAQARRAGDTDDAVRYLLRIIEHDPYDERAHLDLVATMDDAGRHGEARRRYLAYDHAMRELGVEPAPFPRSTSTAG